MACGRERIGLPWLSRTLVGGSSVALYQTRGFQVKDRGQKTLLVELDSVPPVQSRTLRMISGPSISLVMSTRSRAARGVIDDPWLMSLPGLVLLLVLVRHRRLTTEQFVGQRALNGRLYRHRDVVIHNLFGGGLRRNPGAVIPLRRVLNSWQLARLVQRLAAAR
jgi:hypothetical protein